MKNTLKKMTCGLLSVVSIAASAGCAQSSSVSDTSPTEVKTSSSFKGNTEDVTLEKGDTYAIIKIKDFGEIKCKLFAEAAPKGVSNFIELAESGYYTNKKIHRVIKDFMLQGGSANGDGLSTDDDPKFGVEYNKSMRHYYGALCYANGGGVNGTQFYIINNKGCGEFTNASDYESAIKQCESNVKKCEELVKTTTGDEQAYYQYYLDYYKNQKAIYEMSMKAINDRTEEMTERYKDKGGYPFLDGGYTVFGQVVEGFDVIDNISAVEVKANSNGEKSVPVEDIFIESVTIGTVE
ncbi:MAG: peptidylprolyl isomerase [Ruminiclostridium sp.]|nr:peptidylprolyl isomerase [Ruminiclostridium sp.]